MEQLFTHQTNEIAISTLLARMNPELSTYSHYLCCELVDYSAGMNDVFMHRLKEPVNATLDSKRYASLLLESFDGALIHHVSEWPSLFVLGLNEDPEISSTPAAQAHRRPLSTVLPAGSRSQHWIAKMNEIQMVFHQSNENLENDKMPTKPNGVWLWGEGHLQELQDSHLLISAQSPELIAISRAANATLTSIDQILNAESTPIDALIDIHITEDKSSLDKANALVTRSIGLLKSGHYGRLKVQLMQNSISLETSCTKYMLHKFWLKTGKTIDWIRNACN